MKNNEGFLGNHRSPYRGSRVTYRNLLFCNWIITAMSTERDLRQLYQDVHFFAAALSETLISVWEEDPAGVYAEVERGFIDRYTADFVRVRNAETGNKTHYSRDTAMFKRI